MGVPKHDIGGVQETLAETLRRLEPLAGDGSVHPEMESAPSVEDALRRLGEREHRSKS